MGAPERRATRCTRLLVVSARTSQRRALRVSWVHGKVSRSCRTCRRTDALNPVAARRRHRVVSTAKSICAITYANTTPRRIVGCTARRTGATYADASSAPSRCVEHVAVAVPRTSITSSRCARSSNAVGTCTTRRCSRRCARRVTPPKRCGNKAASPCPRSSPTCVASRSTRETPAARVRTHEDERTRDDRVRGRGIGDDAHNASGDIRVDTRSPRDVESNARVRSCVQRRHEEAMPSIRATMSCLIDSTARKEHSR